MNIRSMTALAAGLMLASFNAAAIPILSISPTSGSAVVGGTSSFDILVTDAVDLFAYEFDIGFTPGVIAPSSIVEGSFLAGGGSTFYLPGAIDNVAGTISFTADSLLSAVAGVTGAGILATVSFTGLAEGMANLSLFNVSLLDSSLSNQAYLLAGGSVAVSPASHPAPVPEPGALGLFAIGIAQYLILCARARRDSTARHDRKVQRV